MVTLNRPQRRNALSLELMLELIDGLDDIGRRAIRAVILAAEGKVSVRSRSLRDGRPRYQRIPAALRRLHAS